MSDFRPRVRLYDIFALALSLFAIASVASGMTLVIRPETRRILDGLDLVLCGIFFLDFVRNLATAPNRLRYLYTWGWLDLAASIPVISVFRLGRLGSVIRIVRLLRLLRVGGAMRDVLASHRREGAAYSVGFVYLLVVSAASMAVLEAEHDAPGANITSAGDALWWTMTTISTVGYGDRYPVTTMGRIVASGLMVVGVGLFGTISGVAASWFVQPEKGKDGEGPS